MSERSVNTVIGERSNFKGNLTLSNSIEIKGNFEGDIKTDEDVIVHETGKIKTNVKARSVLIEGKLEGNIDAQKSITIRSKAHVRGDLRGPDLQIQRGANVQCKIIIEDNQQSPEKK